MTVHVLELPGYQLEDLKKPHDEYPEGVFLFKWLMSAFFSKRMDPMSGQAKPLIRLGTDPERVDSSLALLDAFESLRIEATSDGQTVYRLRLEGGHFALDERTVDLLIEYWAAYAGEFLGSGADSRIIKRVNEALERLKKNKLKASEYAKLYGVKEDAKPAAVVEVKGGDGSPDD